MYGKYVKKRCVGNLLPKFQSNNWKIKGEVKSKKVMGWRKGTKWMDGDDVVEGSVNLERLRFAVCRSNNKLIITIMGEK